MSSNEARSIVQSGLDQRKADAKRKEAVLEDKARQLRLTINGNHTMKTLSEAQRRAMEQEAREARKAARKQALVHARKLEEKAVLAVRRYVGACLGTLVLAGFTNLPVYAAVALALGLAVFPVAYIYRLYVPEGVTL